MCQACSPVSPLFLHCLRLLAPQNSLLEPLNAQRCNKNNHPATCRAVGFIIPNWPFSFLVDTGIPRVLEEWDWRDAMTVT